MVELQILDLSSDDIDRADSDDKEKEFVITLYGKTIKDETVVCNISGFKPYFYLKIPKSWSSNIRPKICNLLGRNQTTFSDNDFHIEQFIKNAYNHDPKKDFLESQTTCEQSIDFYGFQCNEDKSLKTYLFAKLYFNSYTAMLKYTEAIREVYSRLQRRSIAGKLNNVSQIHKEWYELDRNDQCDSNLYESNIHPIIRFIHLQKINPCGWIKITNDKVYQASLFPQCNIVITANYKDVSPIDKQDIHPFKIASFDIECDSSHGDFPIAIKDCKKLAIELYEQMFEWNMGDECYSDSSDSDNESIDSEPYYGTNDPDNSDQDSYNLKPKTIYSKYNEDFKNVRRLLHYAFDKYAPNEEKNQNMISRLYTSFIPSDKIINNCIYRMFNSITFMGYIMSNDPKNRDKTINCLTNLLNTHLLASDPKNKHKNKVLGDEIIQIGTVFQKYGSNKPSRRNILVIGPKRGLSDEEICADITDVQDPHIDIIRCQNELELLLKWQELMKAEDPDFVTGYNIFGFDFSYMSDRINQKCNCQKWNGYHTKHCDIKKFYNIGKIEYSDDRHKQYRCKKCSDKKQNLSSSGLGDNNLRYITMDGRILYDLQKEIQKSHSLDSYKLDNVASHFIRGKIRQIECWDRINKSTLITTDIGRLKVGDYISLRNHSNIGEKLFNNGEKFYIYSIQEYDEDDDEDDDYIITVVGLIWAWDQTKQQRGIFKTEWCLNKDDVSPKEIFEKHQTGTGADRALIAKYCIQDCELCINLSLSLEIITNGVSMANVCYVPLSYIYLRGQGAKVFSIVVKECEKQGAKIPTMKRLSKPYDYIKLFGELDRDRSKMKEYLIDERYQDWYKASDEKDWKEEKAKDIQRAIEYPIELEEFKSLSKEYYDDKIKDKPKYPSKPRNLPYKDYSIEDFIDEIVNPPPRDGYEGAIVLEPKPGIYLDDPVSVLDYASLYPSSIIEKNLSHETLIEDPKYLDMVEHETITYDNYMFIEKGKTVKKVINEEEPVTTCHFKKKEEGKALGIIPTVLQHLLTQRGAAKKQLKNEKDEFKKKVWDGLQLAYKVTANSVYGQMGARTSPIYKNKIAACTTSVGRSRIDDASLGVVKWAEEEGLEKPEVIYGDTDSVFVKFSRRNRGGTLLEGEEALKWCIESGDKAGQWITDRMMHQPQVLEYEKTFYPFILISKKRYIGDKYEFSISDCKRTSMGIVLKRRDNAPIVKHVFGNMIEKIMVERDIEGAKLWIKDTLYKIKNGEMNENEFYITKSLRGYYKNPQQIAHKVLADRIGLRDPGNKPKANDRIAYAYIKTPPKYTGEYYKVGVRKGEQKQEKVLQGERIEIRQYIEENKCEYDYEFYITNQIKNPVKQVLELQYDPSQKEELKKLDEIFS